jgi:hypothetical protein
VTAQDFQKVTPMREFGPGFGAGLAVENQVNRHEAGDAE